MCPSGTGYNYFLACDTAERIIFAVVAGSGSGKLCWHSRGTDNNQENAGCVRESAGGSEQALRAEEVQKRSFCRRSFPHFFRCWKKWGRRRQRKRSRRGAKLSPSETNTMLTPLRGDASSATASPCHLSPCGSVHGFDTPPACHSIPRTIKGEGLRGCATRGEGFGGWR